MPGGGGSAACVLSRQPQRSKHLYRVGQSTLHAAPVEPPQTLETDCLVVGGGISGCTLAHNLKVNNVDCLLAEQRDYLGGNVKSHTTEDGFTWEEGPNSFATQPSIVRIAYELGIADELVFADESLPPWVNHNGKLHPLPKGQGGKGPKGQLELVFGPNGVLKFGLVGDLIDVARENKSGYRCVSGPPAATRRQGGDDPGVGHSYSWRRGLPEVYRPVREWCLCWRSRDAVHVRSITENQPN